MTLSSSMARLYFASILGALLASCSGAQQAINLAPAPSQPFAGHEIQLALRVANTKPCQHSPGFGVVPCRLTFTNRKVKAIDLKGAQGSGDTQEQDNCRRLATIGDGSGPLYLVRAKEAKGTCAAVFTHNGKFAILNIDVEL